METNAYRFGNMRSSLDSNLKSSSSSGRGRGGGGGKEGG